MARAHWLTVPAIVVLLAACGDPDTSTTGTTATTANRGTTATTSPAATGAPTVIHLAPSTGGTPETASDTPLPVEGDGGNGSDGQIEPMPIQPSLVTYVTSGDLPALTGSGPSWQLKVGTSPDPAQIERIAHALGVDGAVTRLPADQGGGWVVGAPDSGPSLQVSADGLLSWWYNPSAQAAPEPAKDVPAGAEGSSTPQPPPGVPTKQQATATARELLTAMGLDPSGYELEAYGDEWGASVTAWRLLDGHRSPLSTNFGFGAEGALTWAGGALATPVRGADYPLVGTDAAVQRLNDDQAGWLAISGGGSIASRNAGTPTAEAAPASGAGEECPTPAPDVQLPNPGPDVPVSSDASASAGSAGAPCVPPVASSLPTRVTVTLTKVANDLSTVWDQAGNVWVLPAYTFQDDNGASYTVLAVADQYVEVGKS